jgi:hypothetical protein
MVESEKATTPADYERVLRELQKERIDGTEFINLRQEIARLAPLKERLARTQRPDRISSRGHAHRPDTLTQTIPEITCRRGRPIRWYNHETRRSFSRLLKANGSSQPDRVVNSPIVGQDIANKVRVKKHILSYVIRKC